MDNTATSSIIFGASGTGKTFLVSSIANTSSLPCYVINGSEDDFNSEKFEHITYQEIADDIEEYSNSIIIAEDVVRPNDFECKIINEILVKHKRHSNITFFCLTHALLKNNLHSLVQHFDFVLFTNSIKNSPVFQVYARRYCAKDNEECIHIWNDFVSKEAKTNYLRYNNKLSKFEVIDVKGNIQTGSEEKFRKEIFHYIEPNNEFIKESMQFFDYIMKKLPLNSVTEEDHVLKLRNKNNQIIEVNIIDLIYYVPRKHVDRIPPKNVILAFKALQKLYHIPNCMIGNKHFYDV